MLRFLELVSALKFCSLRLRLVFDSLNFGLELVRFVLETK